MSEIIVALITGGLALLGTTITVAASSRRQRTERQEDLKGVVEEVRSELREHSAKSDARIDALTAQVEKHNKVVERTFKLESDRDNLFHRYDEVHDQLQAIQQDAHHAVERADAAHNRLDRANIMTGKS